MQISKEDEKYFYERVEKTDSCWIWKGGISYKGYGIFNRVFNGKIPSKAHRFSYALFKGEIPVGNFVCHTCDNPPCVNPDHLWLGDAKSNCMDSVSKKRWDHKGPGGKPRLNKEKILEIRRLFKEGLSYQCIGNMFDTHPTNVSRIVKRKCWRHVL